MTERREFLKQMAAGTLGMWLLGSARANKRANRPNILWLIAEDMNPWLSCYGTTLIQTPTFDAMADRKSVV